MEPRRRPFPSAEVLDRLPAGVVVVDLAGRVVHANRAAQELLGPALARPAVRCCDLFGCRRPGTPLADACITERALARTTATPEIRVETPLDADVTVGTWLAAAPVGGVEAAVALQVRPAFAGDRQRRSEAGSDGGGRLRIHVLGRTRLDRAETPLGGEWLAHRPGMLFKYLVTARGRCVGVDELLAAFWPDAPRAGATNVRQAVHTLRDRLEPQREKHRPSAFVVAAGGGYELDREHVWIDADEFEATARAGLDAQQRGDDASAAAELRRAGALYRGDFLADEPYAEWALTERERLRDLAAQTLRALAAVRLRRDDTEGALEPLQRLAELEPFDSRCQRELLEQLLRLQRHAEAQRRYEVVRRRFRRAFGVDPDFALAELAAG